MSCHLILLSGRSVEIEQSADESHLKETRSPRKSINQNNQALLVADTPAQIIIWTLSKHYRNWGRKQNFPHSISEKIRKKQKKKRERNRSEGISSQRNSNKIRSSYEKTYSVKEFRFNHEISKGNSKSVREQYWKFQEKNFFLRLNHDTSELISEFPTI